MSALSDVLYEVIDGRIVELPPQRALDVNLASMLLGSVGFHGGSHKLGRVERRMLFVLDAAKNLQRRPDVAFVSYGRWPRKKRIPRAEAWPVVPELAVEVVSPSNTAVEIIDKIREYFDAGCQRVWVVYPEQEQVYVYRSPTQNEILTRKDDLDGEEFLPGFRMPLANHYVSAAGSCR